MNWKNQNGDNDKREQGTIERMFMPASCHLE
jgi:hypothetical protein